MGKKKIVKLLCGVSAALLLVATLSFAANLPEEPVGEKPQYTPDESLTIFEEPGVLTRKGGFIFEPSLEYIHSSSTKVAIEGFSVVPAVIIGLLNVNELQRDTVIGAVNFKYGLTNRFEVELKVPYVYREESVVERELLTGTSVDFLQESDGNGLGDVEFAFHYQLNKSMDKFPFYIANLRVKSRTGEDPFEVERIDVLAEDDTTVVGETFKEQPTGSGFWGIQPSLTIIYPSDPVVLYANISYLWNIERDLGGTIGEIDPGDAFGISFGMSFAVNDRTSYSLGYSHSTVFDSSYSSSSSTVADFDRTQIGTLNFGLSHKTSDRTRVNLSLGVGVTDEASDLQLVLRFPISFL